MGINFSNIKLEVIDITTNATPDIYINQTNVTFSKRVLEDLGYPQTVQYCVDTSQKVFAIRVCKGNEAKATPFSKPKAEQTGTLSCSSKNLREVIVTMIPDYNEKCRYKVKGEYDAASKALFFDMTTAEKASFYNNTPKDE